ncbi:hypothetical protein L6164_002771 [Bauhinia variegata]|uniref:Uncharacterized protein n=1 Tax=Bauhinia variegata TaxID=167791 RepID=A0ACB9PZC2_BAUVA|nr:hypothetical protein L6164_002771 [Bauhinia variegata]
MGEASNIEVLNHFWVSPPAGSVPPTSLPLTFFDLPWLSISPVTRLFFYEHPYPTHHFIQSVLPTLSKSLSLTLQHFFLFSANLICPPKPHKPHFLFADGDGAVSFTVAESTADIAHLAADYPREVRGFHPLIPQLPSADDINDGSRALPLMAIQVTIFPGSGFSIGIIFNHAVADGRAFHHFIKSWASICRTGRFLEEQEPVHDRGEIEDINGLQQRFLEKWWNEGSRLAVDNKPDLNIFIGKVRATIILGEAQIQNVKSRIFDQYKNDLAATHVSTFVVVCSLIWKELVGELGLVQALKAIGSKVRELEGGVLKSAEKWMMTSEEIKELGQQVMIVAASPKFGVYKTDFGFGKLKKTELVHVDRPGNISLSESRDEEGGVEVGLALPKLQMDNFNAIIKQYLEQT